MKHIFKNTRNLMLVSIAALSITSCNKFLDRPPLSNVTPADYLWNESDLGTYTVSRYNFPTHSGSFNVGTFGTDNGTDNQASSGYSNRWVPGEWRVPQTGGSWNFTQIRQCNYFLETVLPRWANKKLTGSADNIAHYIGEGYFLRAYEYFNKIEAVGDFPILKHTLKDDAAELVAASNRRPRNEVARFIISDLDSAISLLKIAPPSGKNRISKYAAQLFKSRVALHEATWLMYFKGTAFVPGGANWPGTGKVPNFSVDIDSEISYFLQQAMDASSAVADAIPLVNNTKDNGYNSSANPYFTMFSDVNMEKYSEVLMWRAYDPNKGSNNNVNHYINQNGGNTGYTRGFVDNFVMANGLPIYATGSGYQGDDSIQAVKINRDSRLQLFMKVPGDLRYINKNTSTGGPILEGHPDIIGLQETRYVTGYALKKGMSYDAAQSEGNVGSIGSIVFRAAEAYLNYIEASYLKNKTIDAKADKYWRAIRTRAGINPDYNITINATDMAEEAKNDLAAFSAGTLLTDKTLYNIRRERRDEFISEAMRMYDLKRWRSLDQLKTTPYVVQGFKLFGGAMQNWYLNADGSSQLVQPGTAGKTANVSSKSESLYLNPYRINTSANNLVKDGYKWAMAHYLDPIAIQHFLITSPDPSDAGKSVMYQNPGWPMTANAGALF
jgi:hypothetical protein